MSVMLIGDKRVGKTTLLVELAKNGGNESYVKVIEPTYRELTQEWYSKSVVEVDGDKNEVFQADVTRNRNTIEFKIEVELPSDTRRLKVLCVDTPGEFWKELLGDVGEVGKGDSLLVSMVSESVVTLTEGGESFVAALWKQQLIEDFKKVKGIVLVLAPPRSMLNEQALRRARISRQEERFLSDQDWVRQFKVWLQFLAKHITNQQQVLICLNMADLFCDLRVEAQRLRYELSEIDLDEVMDWYERCDYVLRTYFGAVKGLIDDYNVETDGNLLQTVITSKESRQLLELPWLYLADYLPKEKVIYG